MNRRPRPATKPASDPIGRNTSCIEHDQLEVVFRVPTGAWQWSAPIVVLRPIDRIVEKTSAVDLLERSIRSLSCGEAGRSDGQDLVTDELKHP